MAFRIILSALALNELETAVDWYNSREENLGKRFIESVEERLVLLSHTPALFPIKSSGYNEVLVEKFPYLIVYRIVSKTKTVRVLHIFHTRRDPAKKK
jgi:plasmid stabilization system protein ParE